MTVRSRHVPGAVVVALAMLALGSIAAAFTTAWPTPALAVFPEDPQPTLVGTPAEVADILFANLAVLVVPLLFAGAAAGKPGPWRIAGDLATAGIVAVNSLSVGAALALHGTALLPYLPHLPVEGAALALAGSTWLSHRSSHSGLVRAFAAIVVLAVAAALIEVYATPPVAR
jgi:hypothetical protein